MKISVISLESLLPKAGYSPSTSKSTARPFSSLITLTFAYFIADNESATTDKPAIPHASVRSTFMSCKAICSFS